MKLKFSIRNRTREPLEPTLFRVEQGGLFSLLVENWFFQHWELEGLTAETIYFFGDKRLQRRFIFCTKGVVLLAKGPNMGFLHCPTIVRDSSRKASAAVGFSKSRERQQEKHRLSRGSR